MDVQQLYSMQASMCKPACAKNTSHNTSQALTHLHNILLDNIAVHMMLHTVSSLLRLRLAKNLAGMHLL